MIDNDKENFKLFISSSRLLRLTAKPDTMHAHKKEMKRVFRVYMPSYWKDGECTCPDFLKNYKCEHYLGASIQSENDMCTTELAESDSNNTIVMDIDEILKK